MVVVVVVVCVWWGDFNPPRLVRLNTTFAIAFWHWILNCYFDRLWGMFLTPYPNPLNLVYIFRTPFHKITYERLLLPMTNKMKCFSHHFSSYARVLQKNKRRNQQNNNWPHERGANILLKIDFDSCIFLWILRNFFNTLFTEQLRVTAFDMVSVVFIIIVFAWNA